MQKIIHVDMDCFFAAIEMRENPELVNIPIAIGGTVESRGVICAANYPARRYGIHSAMSTVKALRLCPHIKLLPVRMGVYESVSKQIHEIFSRYTHRIEPLSLDEAYLDVTDCVVCYGSATLIAQEIRRAIYNELELTASAGVAPIKFLAKIASDINKPNGQYVISPDQVDFFIRSLPLYKIPGVGPKTARRLAILGFYTCADVQQSDLITIVKVFGKLGFEIWQRCHGIDTNHICTDPVRKTVGVELTLPKDIHSWQECECTVRTLYPELYCKLQQYSADLGISRQGVKFKFDDFSITTHEHKNQELDVATSLSTARYVWETRRNDRGVRLIGLNATLRDPLFERQLSFKW
ncbi:DNA polymerase-4 [Pseudomonas sp. NFACC23-1]|uniref:DNA polymerase IV n=1 Tax=unclassified Pseudomonas TaxID=196821 RepID=UPI00088CDE16|nr:MULTISPECIES: DNA polymerase IV [unclassified Pseudomonas]SDB66404.1 DNA polymerase-4 [Pseudomonas sp. NFACC17-2]SEJ97341.1 DNA polymerase-4 [Pseudomonas sp. NFACC23-1]SFW92988.1 DNA polymerase-4 [Pseudomonas sp. NFACC16-2]